MRRLLLCFCGIGIAFSMIGCDMFGPKGLEDLKGMAIKGAQAIFVSPKESAGESDMVKNTLFKITDDGAVEEIAYTDDKGEELELQVNPMAIHDVNDKYVIILFGSDELNPYNGYLVDKETEAVYDLGEYLPTPPSDYYRNGKKIQSDGSNNIYFRYWDGENNASLLRKIDVSDPASLESSLFSRDTDYVDNFSIDLEGNAIYLGCLQSNRSSQVKRIQKANGGIDSLSEAYPIHWTGRGGDLYYAYYDSGTTSGIIKKVSVDDSNETVIDDYGSIGGFYPSMSNSYLLQLSDRLAILNDQGKIYEVENGSGDPTELDVSATFTQVVAAGCSSDAYFVAGTVDGEEVLMKIDPDIGTAADIVAPGDYSFYKFIVDDAGMITFNAIRYDDGVKVIGQVDASGDAPFPEPTIIDDEMDAEVLILERIQ